MLVQGSAIPDYESGGQGITLSLFFMIPLDTKGYHMVFHMILHFNISFRVPVYAPVFTDKCICKCVSICVSTYVPYSDLPGWRRSLIIDFTAWNRAGVYP